MGKRVVNMCKLGVYKDVRKMPSEPADEGF